MLTHPRQVAGAFRHGLIDERRRDKTMARFAARAAEQNERWEAFVAYFADPGLHPDVSGALGHPSRPAHKPPDPGCVLDAVQQPRERGGASQRVADLLGFLAGLDDAEQQARLAAVRGLHEIAPDAHPTGGIGVTLTLAGGGLEVERGPDWQLCVSTLHPWFALARKPLAELHEMLPKGSDARRRLGSAPSAGHGDAGEDDDLSWRPPGLLGWFRSLFGG